MVRDPLWTRVIIFARCRPMPLPGTPSELLARNLCLPRLACSSWGTPTPRSVMVMTKVRMSLVSRRETGVSAGENLSALSSRLAKRWNSRRLSPRNGLADPARVQSMLRAGQTSRE